MSKYIIPHPEGIHTGTVMSLQTGYSTKLGQVYASLQIKTSFGGLFVPVGVEYIRKHLPLITFGQTKLTVKVTHVEWEKAIRIKVSAVGVPSV